MAEVWLASTAGERARRDGLSASQQVVLKTILPQYVSNRDFVSMFVREAALAAQLNHPAIIQVYDLGVLDGRYFIEMEYVAGRTLRELLRRGREASKPLSLWSSLQIVADCCDGLMYAHEFRDHEARPIGLVHRDMSPENVMISFSGKTKIFDFGIATTKTSNLTNVGNFKGKLCYLPPETFEGAPPHKSRDIYALGVILYELVTGTRPFKSNSEAELIYRITQGVPRPASELNPALPPQLVSLIAAMLARDPRERPESAGSVASELRSLVPSSQLGAAGRAQGLGAFMRTLFPEHASDGSGLAAALAALPPELGPIAAPAAVLEGDAGSPVSAPRTESRGSQDLVKSVPRGSSTADLFPDPPTRTRVTAGSTADLFELASGRRASDTNLFSLAPRSSAPRQPERAPMPLDSEGDEPPCTPYAPEREAARHFDRGFDLLRAGDVSAALEAWDRARALDPDNRAYDVNLKKLKRQLEESHGSR